MSCGSSPSIWLSGSEPPSSRRPANPQEFPCCRRLPRQKHTVRQPPACGRWRTTRPLKTSASEIRFILEWRKWKRSLGWYLMCNGSLLRGLATKMTCTTIVAPQDQKLVITLKISLSRQQCGKLTEVTSNKYPLLGGHVGLMLAGRLVQCY